MLQESTSKKTSSKIWVGGDRLRKGDFAGAFDAWEAAWELIRDELPDDVRTCAAADELIGSDFLSFNWTQDAVMYCVTAARDDESYAPRGARLARELLNRFTDEKESYEKALTADLAELLYLSGEHEAAFVLVDAERQKEPEEAHWWVLRAQFLSDEPDPDPEAAGDVLREALEHPVRNAADFDVVARLEGLTGEKVTLDHPEPTHVGATGTTGPYRADDKPGRNEPCWCGSGKKYKKCHLRQDQS